VKLLVLGGTVFLGRHVVEAALEDGHEVTIFTRGRTNPELYPEVEHLRGHRDGELGALHGRAFDAVVDPSGFVPRVVRQSGDLLADAVERYVFISTISVYADPSRPLRDDSPLAELTDPHDEDVATHYGALKAACEAVLDERYGARATSVRAGLIAGPFDPTNRFTYWCTRLARGGDVLAPGDPDRPVQFIDARDLAEWVVRLAERGHGGSLNATGPEAPLTMADALTRIATGVGGEGRLVWIDDRTLLDAGVEEWTELPLWIADPAFAGMLRADVSRALAAGLHLRPAEQTAADTLAWAASAGDQRAALTADKERRLLDAAPAAGERTRYGRATTSDANSG
jgi:2'-hydroxyisoflavone reductase